MDRVVRICPNHADPLVALVFLEVIRCRRRFGDAAEGRCFEDAEPVAREYLHGIGPDLLALLRRAAPSQRADVLEALGELRVDTGDALLPLLTDSALADRRAVLTCLRYSTDPRAGNEDEAILMRVTGVSRSAGRAFARSRGRSPLPAGDRR